MSASIRDGVLNPVKLSVLGKWAMADNYNKGSLCGGLGLVVRAKSWLVGLVVEKLLHSRVTAIGPVVPIERLLRSDEIVLGIVIGHFAHAAHRILGRLESLPVLLQQFLGHLRDFRFELARRYRFVDEAGSLGLPAGKILSEQGVIH